ncbi:MAG: (d)CMP kinase [Paludibacteraceae bacterium]|nr:(d)CMP kinase [Paludibacteraceae bacterium]
MKKISIAIDGFSSCGKSTMAKELARAISYIYVDTGAMYRVVTLAALRAGVMVDGEIDEEKLRECVSNLNINLDANAKVYLNGEDVESEIRGLEVSNWVSKVSAIGFVREKLLDIQRELGASKGVVMDGRDIGSVVLPDAELKIFVTADADVRAKRRYDELLKKGSPATYQEVLDNIKMRDYNDLNRKVSPLVQSPDAILLDNSFMSIEEQNAWLLDKVNKVCNQL